MNKGRVGSGRPAGPRRYCPHPAGADGRAGAFQRAAAGRFARAGPVLPILFEDDALIAVDKPSGLAVHGGSGIAQGLIEQLRAARPDAKFLELVHRLDRETSGILLVAKKRAALVGLHEQLREGAFDKRYLVLVRGRWRDEKRRVRLSLHKFATHEGERRVRVEEGGQAAETIFFRRRAWFDHDPPLALLEAELKTGRTHQIRVHLTHLGFPLAGDDKYGDFAWNKVLAKQGLKRMFLHSFALGFVHPLTGKAMSFESPLPADLARFVARLDAATAAAYPMRDAASRRFELLVFDWDGTLVDSTVLIALAMQEACRDLGLAVPDDMRRALRDRAGVWRRAQVRGAGAAAACAIRSWGRTIASTISRAKPRSRCSTARRELLAELDAAGYLLAVATGKTRAGLDRALEKNALARCVPRDALRRRRLSQAAS